MSLNIKSEEAHRLAKRLAEQTGESLTAAVTNALKARLSEVEREADIEDLTRIAKACAEYLRAAPGPQMEIEDLYDEETGLPR